MNNSKISRNRKKVKTEMPVKIGFPLDAIMYRGENYKSVNVYKYKSTILPSMGVSVYLRDHLSVKQLYQFDIHLKVSIVLL